MKKQEVSCPIEQTMNLVSGKWKLIILWHLSEQGVLRYGELKKALHHITHKMLSQQLKELENDGFILRTAYPEIPPKVEYALSELGQSFLPILAQLSDWGAAHL